MGWVVEIEGASVDAAAYARDNGQGMLLRGWLMPGLSSSSCDPELDHRD
jgi:hypothetical protein